MAFQWDSAGLQSIRDAKLALCLRCEAKAAARTLAQEGLARRQSWGSTTGKSQ
jgi:hypothetical protein